MPDDRPLSSLRSFAVENKVALICLLLVFVTWKTFIPCFYNDFINFDDHEYVYNNPQVTSGLTWETVKWAFTSSVGANWHPLTMLTHILDWEMYGANPRGHHLLNVFLHCGSGALAFLILHRLTGTCWRAFIVALFFAVHPLRVESVAWVSERKDTLSTFFWMLGTLAYIQYVLHRASNMVKARRYYGMALLWLALGLLSKPMLVTFPCVLLLLDFWPLGRRQEGFLFLLKEKVPFFVLSAIFSAITITTQDGAMYPYGVMPLSVRLQNVPVSYARYLGKIFYPVDLSIFYPYPLKWPVMKVVASSVLVVGISVFAIIAGRRRPYLLIGWLWFIGTLFPVIGLTQAGRQSMADRYSYIPSFGLLIMVVWLLHDLVKRWNISPRLVGVAVGFIGILSSVLTRGQIAHWKDSESVFRHAARVTEKNFIAHSLVGFVDLSKTNYAAAITNFQTALKVRPDMPEAHVGLGFALMKSDRAEEALDSFHKAIELQPENALAYKELGAALISLGRRDEAITNLLQALKLEPDFKEAQEEMHKLTNAVASSSPGK